MAGQVKITFTGGSLLGEERTIQLDGFAMLGRSHSATVRLKEPDVSGRHLEFRAEADGVYAVCLSRNGFTLNGGAVSEGDSRKISVDDVVMLGSRVRFRVDAVLDDSRDDVPEVSTFATRAADPGATATIATQFAKADEVPVPEGATFATMMADASVIAAAGASAESLRGSVEETPLDEANSVSAPAPAPVARPPLDDSPTQDEGDNVETSVDAAADFGLPPYSPDDQPTGSRTGLSDGETVEMKTRQASMDEIFRMKRMLELKKRFRMKMIVFAAFALFSMLGVIVYSRWPRQEQYLTNPVSPGSNDSDFASFVVKSRSGSVDLEVKYPKSPGMIVRESESGIEVSTMTGRDRDVPFRLSFAKRSDLWQLRHSLGEAAEREMDALCGAGYVFFRADDDKYMTAEERSGFFFFEILHKGWCRILTQRGTRFFRKEFTRTEGDMKWHGLLIVFRNGTYVYRLLREIPDSQWARGKYLLREFPNLALYPGFLRRHWESPGEAGLKNSAAPAELRARVRELLDKGWPADWGEITMCTDTLVVKSFEGSKEDREMASSLLAEFRKAKDNAYRLFENRYRIAVSNENKKDVEDVFNACYGAFGNDPLDMRSRSVNDPKEWSCQLSR